MKHNTELAFPILLPNTGKADLGSIFKRTSEDSTMLDNEFVGQLVVSVNPMVTRSNERFEAQHLYLIVNEPLKEGDWFVWKDEIHCYHSDAGYGIKTYTDYNHEDGSSLLVNHSNVRGKIIATSDSNLGWSNIGQDEGFHTIGNCYKGNGMIVEPLVPIIPESFIKAYVDAQGDICEVLVEYDNFIHPEGMAKYPDFLWLPKRRNDGTVIIHRVKTYTTKDMLLFGEYIMKLSNNVIRKNTRMTPLDGETGPQLVRDLFKEWDDTKN